MACLQIQKFCYCSLLLLSSGNLGFGSTLYAGGTSLDLLLGLSAVLGLFEKSSLNEGLAFCKQGSVNRGGVPAVIVIITLQNLLQTRQHTKLSLCE
jgi:hypothetical protein